MPPITESVINRYFYPVGGAIMAVGFVAGANFFKQKPPFSGIQRHILAAAFAGFLGEHFQQRNSKFYSDRDALIRHYVELHPEDFKEEKKKYKDILDPWIPIR